jgi:hypothetical protein
MSETPPEGAGPDPLAVIGELTAALEGVRDDLRSFRGELRSVREDSEARDKALARAGHRRNRVIIALIVSFCLDVALTIGVTVATVRAGDASNRAAVASSLTAATVAQLHASNISACKQANVNRAQDIAIWDTFLGELAPPSARTPAVAAKLAVINAKIRVKDAPRNCAALYATKG